jgi:hypothetical protein
MTRGGNGSAGGAVQFNAATGQVTLVRDLSLELDKRIELLFPIEAPEHRPQVPIVPATLGERAGAIGAAAIAADLRP